jgi:M6 family metalloprotease-like protein
MSWRSMAAVLAATGWLGSAPAGAAPPSACAPQPTFPGVTAGRSTPGTVTGSTGVVRVLVLSVEFTDAAGDYPTAEHLAPAEQVAGWYRAVSYGRLELETVDPGRWFRLSASAATYAAQTQRYLAEAIAAADPFVDFSRVDALWLVPTARAVGLDTAFAMLNGFGVRADGREIRQWVHFAAGAGRADPYPWLHIHETGHLLGLPDLYTANTPAAFHRWDVMAARYPSELLAWHRWKLGWLAGSQVTCVAGRSDQRVVLTPLGARGGRKAVFVRRGNDVIAAELRTSAGYDRGLCRPGVLVYRVDTTPLRRAPVQLFSQGTTPRTRVGRCGNGWNATFRPGQTFRFPDWRLRIAVLARLADGSYRVRVTRR